MAEPVKARDIVLVVDDSPETLGFLTDALERFGATVLVATEGAQALDIAERITPDIVLMDAVMPGMDGFETTRRMKRNAALAHVPVIFMGWGIRPGLYHASIAVNDIAPTLATMLEIETPSGSVGRVLTEILVN